MTSDMTSDMTGEVASTVTNDMTSDMTSTVTGTATLETSGGPVLPRRTWGERWASWEWLLGAFAIATLLVGWLTTENFFSSYNVESSISRMAAKSLLVLPLVFLIIAREIDISVASVAALSGIMFGLATREGLPFPVAIAVAVLTGLGCGAINGFLVTKLKLPSLVVTLGSLAMFRGLCYVLVGGTPISNMPAPLLDFANGSVGNTFIPLAIVPFLIAAPVAVVILHRTTFGRRVYAIGGSPETARYSGVRIERTLFVTFVASGLMASIAGIIEVGRLSSATPDGLLGFELDAVAVAFLGGISFLGGRGRLTGVVWALVVVIAVRSKLQLDNVAAYGQSAVLGMILIGSLLLANVVAKLQRARATKRTVAERTGAERAGAA